MMRLLILLFLGYISIFAQERDPNELLKTIQTEFNKIKDYTVDIEIDIDVNYVDAPNSKAKLYFKQPDKIKIETDGFAILPKQGIVFSPSELLSESYTAILVKSEPLDSFMVDVIKVVPLTDSSNIILSTLWVDPLYRVIRKIESVTKNMGTITIYLSYESDYPQLPSKAKFFFNMAKIGHAAMFNNSKNNDSNKEKKGISGTVIIKYSNYLINQGLDDSIFVEEE